MDEWHIGFAYPFLWALLPPLLLVWWFIMRHAAGAWGRLLFLFFLIAALSHPEARWGRGGADVILLLDRSGSMPADALRQQSEYMQLLGEQRQSGDRLGVISFGNDVQILQGPQEVGLPRLADSDVRSGATDIDAALESAARLIPPLRHARVILASDGESTGIDPRRAASALGMRNIVVDSLPALRPPAADAAIMRVEVPGSLRLGESFIGSIQFASDREVLRQWTISRAGRELASGTVAILPGEMSTVSFVDRPDKAGLAEYRVTLDGHNESDPDRQPLNNRAQAAVRVSGAERVLIMSSDGKPGNLANALSAAGLQVDCRLEGPIGIDELLGYRVLILEQVPAGRLTHASMLSIAQWVEHLGGGLIMTGGRRSFGNGGYHRSPIESILPVTMEIRDEHRKLSVAMAVCLDRSGSMGAAAGAGTKMDLANAGTIAAIGLLGPMDEVSVFAVDSAAHTIVKRQTLENPGEIIDRVRRIESSGGGIYTYNALVAGGESLLGTQRATQHLVLFADANDAEQPDDYRNLLQDYQQVGITVSVIGLGRETDSDADFLKDIAKRGGGRIVFSTEPGDLPRLFAEETMLVAKSSWIDETASPQPRPGLVAVLGPELAESDWPQIVGYNMVYPRNSAQIIAGVSGEFAAPIVSSWHIGTGRSVAIAMDLDAPENTALRQWDGYVSLVAGLTRWASGDQQSQLGAISAEQIGNQARIQLTLDPAQRTAWPGSAPTVVLTSDDNEARQQALIAIDDGVFEAIVPLPDTGAIVPAAVYPPEEQIAALVGPALSVPYQPEARPRYGLRAGSDILQDLANSSGGQLRQDLFNCFRDLPASPGRIINLSAWLLALAVLVLVTEILWRRLQLRFPFSQAKAATQARTEPALPTSSKPIVAEESSGDYTKPESPEALGPDTGLHAALQTLKNRQK